MAELVFFSGTMDCGKSTLALQTAYNHERRGMRGLLYSRNDRAGTGRLSSRIGLESRAFEVDESTDFWKAVARERTGGRAVDFLICDEVQFYTEAQIEQLARIVDEIEIDVNNRILRANVSDEELERRRAEKGAAPWKPSKPRARKVSDALRVYGMLAASADKGGVRVLPDWA